MDRNNPEEHDARTKLWNDFNNAWLALFEFQKNRVVAARLDQPTLQQLGIKLARLCDELKGKGLVDCQHGIWRHVIMRSEYAMPKPFDFRLNGL